MTGDCCIMFVTFEGSAVVRNEAGAGFCFLAILALAIEKLTTP
jgi:hypothetical protein